LLTKLFLTAVVFAGLLLAVNVAHFALLPVNVVLYGALMDVACALVVCALVSWIVIFRGNVPPIVFSQMLIILALGGYIFAISVPTIIDRSYSIYLLEKIQQQSGSIREAAFDEAITQEFMRDHQLNGARFTEQLESGTITIEDGCVKLTERGARIASFTRWYRQNLLPKHRLLMGKYTDALTDPFRHSVPKPEYSCPR
jgi:hypothetical protein